MARIAVGGFQHETNTFAPQQATWEDFVRADAWPGLLRGPEMIDAVEGYNIPIAGAVKRLGELGHEIVPLAGPRRRRPPTSPRTPTSACGRCSTRTSRKLGPFDAIYLDLHGAMVAENTEDGEGELLRRIRGVVGDDAADRGEPRLSRQFDAGDGEAGDRAGRLPHLSAYRHGGDRQARRRAARPAA